MKHPQALKIVISAMGGQGGGVLATWLAMLGEDNGYLAQTTSVPGVAQRTGATIYYVEFFPLMASAEEGKAPVLSLMPTPGDVDIVVAAELGEAGRAISRGFVTKKTVLVASSHRDYAISEKSAMADGRLDTEVIFNAARKQARLFIECDMQEAANTAGAAISAVLFGAVAGSGALPFDREKFEQQIKNMQRSIEANMRGFDLGFELAQTQKPEQTSDSTQPEPEGTASARVAPIIERFKKEIPMPAQYFAFEGLKRVIDYQGVKYAHSYLDRMQRFVEADRNAGGESRAWELSTTAAKHLAVWMSYDDAIRVADLKTRESRFDRVKDDVRVDSDQIFHISEYMHPRVEEICDILPMSIARVILKNKVIYSSLKRLLGDGKRVQTTKLTGYLPLYFLSLLRVIRPASSRYGVEQRRINQWIEAIVQSASHNYALALEVTKLQRLIKGYGDTHERGLQNYERIFSMLVDMQNETDAADSLSGLIDAALADDDGRALQAKIESMTNRLQLAS